MANPSNDVIPAITFSMPGGGGDRICDPNSYFAERFPEAVERYGAAFMVGSWTDPFQQTHLIPVHLNIDFFSGVLAGDSLLGHQTVFHSQEKRFYFYDPMVDAYVPTTEAKLELLLSNEIIRCSQACSRLTDIRPLVETFRKPTVLNSVIQRAKAMLQADTSFFMGKDGHRRFVDGRYIKPTDELSYRLFVKETITPDPDASVTVPAAFDRYMVFCAKNHMSALQRTEFKALVADVIREQYHLGIRHDIDNGRGQTTHGWRGLSLVQPIGDVSDN
jgi:hypothetical protein